MQIMFNLNSHKFTDSDKMIATSHLHKKSSEYLIYTLLSFHSFDFCLARANQTGSPAAVDSTDSNFLRNPKLREDPTLTEQDLDRILLSSTSFDLFNEPVAGRATTFEPKAMVDFSPELWP